MWGRWPRPEQVFLFDLLALPLDAGGALDRCLKQLLGFEKPWKLGCGLAGDLLQLARAFPAMSAFHHAAGTLELRWGPN